MPFTRAQRSRRVATLREQKYTHEQIASMLGLSQSYVYDLIHDPTGEKTRRRKDSYRGTCKTCGASTDGSNGPNQAPEYCKKHAGRAHFMYWTESRIIAAIQEWDFIYNRPPIATDWNGQVEGSPGQYVKGSRRNLSRRRWPSTNAVQRLFGSWANGIEAAGFLRPKMGYYRDESKRGAIRTKWTKDSIVEWIEGNANGDYPPTSHSPGAPANAARREFGGWSNALAVAGYKPRRRIARSTR